MCEVKWVISYERVYMYMALTCTAECANAVAPMMKEIWKKYDQYCKQQDWMEPKLTQQCRGVARVKDGLQYHDANLRMMLSFYRQGT